MKKFKIEEYVIENQCDGSSLIKLTLRPNGYLLTEDINGLKETIENINDAPANHYIYCGRGNGKLNYFSDWCRVSASYSENICFEIKRVILHDPATIVFWEDGTKTVVKCQDGDTYSPEVGIAMCYMKKALGNKSNFNNTFKKHISIVEKRDADIKKVVDKPEKKPTRSYSHLDTEAIYRILRVNKWTVKEFAQVVGVDHSSVYHWLKGGGIKKRNISKMVKALHVPEEAIIKEEK